MKRLRCIAWDFDGVLNRNVVNGQFVWQEKLGEVGIEKQQFEAFMFADGFWPIMRGEEDLLHRLARFCEHAGLSVAAEDLLQHWFASDSYPCPNMLRLMARLQSTGLRQIIATNNEHRRSTYIEQEMGYGARVEKVYSSGRMGVAKPDLGFFRAIEKDTGLAPDQILFVDDYRQNTDAASACGWQVHHFPEDGHAELRHRLRAVL